jgi:hypothetical protein
VKIKKGVYKMGKITGKPGPDPRPPIGQKSVRGFGEGGASGNPLEVLTEKEAKRTEEGLRGFFRKVRGEK